MPINTDAVLLRNCLGNLYAAVQRFGRRPDAPVDLDVQFAMREAAQLLGPPYSELETSPVPAGHFWRGDIDPAECRHCRNPHSAHLHTDEASLCPTGNR